jgi:hypothetical protein
MVGRRFGDADLEFDALALPGEDVASGRIAEICEEPFDVVTGVRFYGHIRNADRASTGSGVDEVVRRLGVGLAPWRPPRSWPPPSSAAIRSRTG